MAVDLLTVCEWTGPRMQSDDIADPDWTAVEAAIRALDNRSKNDLYLTPDKDDPETYLCVGGGDGRYLVSGSVRNETFPTAVDPAKPAEEEEPLVVGGQEGVYPSRWILGLELALRAAKLFYDTRAFGSEVTWEEA